MLQEISLSEIKQVTEVIYQKFGYDFKDYAVSSFRRRIMRILELKHYKTVAELIAEIQANRFTKEDLLHEITVNVTELFRDPSFWRSLKETMPKLFLNQEKIRIWHAGCSSGEEVYSMLVLLSELNMLHKAELVATDIDRCILDKAKLGQIHIRNMELNEKNYFRYNASGDLKKYFTFTKDYASLHPELLKIVDFRELNLVSPKMTNKFDLILCRNVMIYFNQQLQNEVIKYFHHALNMYGYLAIGSKESIIWSEYANKFVVVNQEEKVYKKFKE